MKKSTFRKLLQLICHYTFFLLIVAFVITCCMLLFLNTLAKTMNITFTSDNISLAAKETFFNVLLLSLLMTLFDAVRRKRYVDRPIQKITAAGEKIMQGDFSVRIQPVQGILGADSFNEIIECFNQMAGELSGTETLRTDFIANVSHELKTPLAVMANYATMLQQPNLPEEDRKAYAKVISEAARKLADLITNILKLNKLENQQIFPASEEFDLGEQLAQCLLQFENVWEQKNLSIEADIQDDVRIRSDPELLGLVWNNLFSNAVKFTPEGGTLGVTLSADETWVRVSVSDTGCGIRPEVGQHIFEKFYQGDTSHATQGNGLGLALVKRVVDILNCEINVESTWGKGSVFTVSIRRT